MQYEGEFRVRGDFLSIHRIFFFFKEDSHRNETVFLSPLTPPI